CAPVNGSTHPRTGNKSRGARPRGMRWRSARIAGWSLRASVAFRRSDDRITLCGVFTGKLAPQPNVCDPFFVAGHDHFSSLRDGAALVSAGATGAARASLVVNNFSGARLANGKRYSAKHADHVVISGVKFFLLRGKHPGQEDEHEACSDKARDCGRSGNQQRHHCGMASEQIASSAKPRKKSGGSYGIDERNRGLPMSAARAMRMNHAAMQMDVKRQVPAQASHEKRNNAEGKTHGKAEKIKIGPCHSDRLPSRAFGSFAASGCKASSSRSASPGVLRIAPSNRRQRRVSFSRAALIKTSLTSGSLAKRSEPCSSQTSSLPSTVRKSEVSSVWWPSGSSRRKI